MITIYSIDGSVLLETNVSDRSGLYCSLDNKNRLTLHFTLDRHVDIPVGSWCTFEGNRYEVMSNIDVKMNHTESYEYAVVFSSEFAAVSRYKVYNIVDNRLKFDLVAKPHEHVELIVANLNRRGGGWTVGECIESVEKLVSYNHSNCEEALNSIASAFETEIEVVGKVISLKKVEYYKDYPMALSYGKGNGFRPGIQKTSVDGGLPVSRLFVQGGSRNISLKEYGSSELHLPKDVSFLFDGSKFNGEDGYNEKFAKSFRTDENGLSIIADGVDVGREDSIDLSDVYPSRVGTVTEVVYLLGGKEYSAPQESWTEDDWNSVQIDIVDSTIPDSLDFNEYLLENNEPMTVVFQSGMLGGREFNATYVPSKKRLELEKQEYDGQPMPQNAFVPVVGNTYAVFNVYLPQAYISDATTHSGAEYDLLREASRFIYEKSVSEFTFEGEIDGMWAKKNWSYISPRIRIGSYVSFTHDKMFPDKPALVRIVGYTQYVNNPHYPKIELSNHVGVSSLSSRIDKIENNDAHVEELYESSRRYTRRRFSDVKQTMEMLAKAFDNYEASIRPIAVETMSLIVGDERLQYMFTKSLTSNDEVELGFVYDSDSDSFTIDTAYIKHMTFGIKSVSPVHNEDEYRRWTVEGVSEVLNKEYGYYLYAKVLKDGNTGRFVIERDVQKDTDDSYLLLVGILNSDNGSGRSFSKAYGYTEVLPGQITTELIKSADGSCYFDLANNEIGGAIKFKPGSEGLENIAGNLNIGGQNMLLNSGFTGDSLSEKLADGVDSNVESNPFAYWEVVGNIRSATLPNVAASGAGATFGLGDCSLKQTLYSRAIAGESYVVSFKASSLMSGAAPLVTIKLGDKEVSTAVDGGWKKYILRMTLGDASADEFSISGDNVIICDLKLESGLIATAWSISPLDNNSGKVYYNALKYLSDALKEQTMVNGGLILSTLIRLGIWNGDALDEKAGMNGLHYDENTPAFWAGGSMSEAEALIATYLSNPNAEISGEQSSAMARFAVTHGGKAILNDAVFRGDIYAKGGYFSGRLQLPFTPLYELETGNEKSVSFTTDKGNSYSYNMVRLLVSHPSHILAGADYYGGSVIALPNSTEFDGWVLNVYCPPVKYRQDGINAIVCIDDLTGNFPQSGAGFIYSPNVTNEVDGTARGIRAIVAPVGGMFQFISVRGEWMLMNVVSNVEYVF